MNPNTFDFLDLIHISVFIYNCELSKFLYVNQHFEKETGYTLKQLENKSLDFLWTNAPENRRFESLSEENSYSFLCATRTSDLLAMKLKPSFSTCDKSSDKILTGTLYLATSACSCQPSEQPETFSTCLEELAHYKAKASEYERLANLLIERNETLKALADTDDLTCLYNRYYLDRRILSEIERAFRYNQPLSLVLFDIDHFKNINDTWGHPRGDQVLIAIADLVTEQVRYPDVIARWGGEEFAVLLPQTNLSQAGIVAEKLRSALERYNHPGIGCITASFGVAEIKENEPWESWFKRVDIALYQAKDQGRNKVILNDDISESNFTYVRINWDRRWESGHEIIDQQHRELLEVSNHLLERFLSKDQSVPTLESLDGLCQLIIAHFDDEENYQKTLGYPNHETHSEKHRLLTNRVMMFREKFESGEVLPSTFFTFIIDEVIMNHLLTEDVKFYPYITSTQTV